MRAIGFALSACMVLALGADAAPVRGVGANQLFPKSCSVNAAPIHDHGRKAVR